MISRLGGGIMSGVAVTTPGVGDGMGDWIGNGCGATPQQAESIKPRKINIPIFFMA